MQPLYGKNSSWRPASHADAFTQFSERLNGFRLNTHVPSTQSDIGRRAVHDITPLGRVQSYAVRRRPVGPEIKFDFRWRRERSP